MNKLLFSPSNGCSTYNLVSIGPAVSEEMFENVNDADADAVNGRQTTAYPDELIDLPWYAIYHALRTLEILSQ